MFIVIISEIYILIGKEEESVLASQASATANLAAADWKAKTSQSDQFRVIIEEKRINLEGNLTYPSTVLQLIFI